jgi:hypothetical protein
MPTKSVVLYLEDWQMRMIKDFLGVDCDTYTVEISDPVIFRYGVRTNEQVKRMYFTDWQIREMKDLAGSSCEFIELHKEALHTLYAVFHKQP